MEVKSVSACESGLSVLSSKNTASPLTKGAPDLRLKLISAGFLILPIDLGAVNLMATVALACQEQDLNFGYTGWMILELEVWMIHNV